MAKPGPKTDDSEARVVTTLKLSPTEREMIERVRADRGDDYGSDTLRAVPMIWVERVALLRAVLEPVRGRYTSPEVDMILGAMNGTHLLHGLDVADGLPDLRLLGHHLAPNVHDTDPAPAYARLARQLHGEPAAVRIALELWCAWLWTRHEDDELWERERAWLSGSGAPSSS